jgi:TatD DNase family protein
MPRTEPFPPPPCLPAPGLIDTHAHLDRAYYKGRLEAVVREARETLLAVVTVGVGGGDRGPRAAVALAESQQHVFATVGLHPHDARLDSPELRAVLDELARRPRVVAVGETGLDYFYDRSPRAAQQEAFRAQVRLARAVSKPLVLHIRDAWPDALTILREEGAREVGGVVHCFTGAAPDAEAALALGFHLGVTGIATYAHADALRDVLSRVPLDRLVVETDAPYLTPLAVRHERPNRPALVVHVARALAEWRGLSFEEVARVTTANARRLFGLPAPAPEPLVGLGEALA